MSTDASRPATARRLERAQREGDVAVSRPLTRAVVLAGLLAVGVGTASSIAVTFADLARAAVSLAFGSRSWRAGLELGMEALFVTCAPLFAIACLGAITATLVQAGPVFALRRVVPDPGRLRPPTSSERTANTVIDVAASLAVVAGFATLAWDSAYAMLRIESVSDGIDVLASTSLAHTLAAVVVLFAVGLLDFAWRRALLARRLRMTPREQQEEAREQEANPQVRARLRRGA